MEPAFQSLCLFGICFCPFILLKIIDSLLEWRYVRKHEKATREMGSSDVIVKSKVVGTKRRESNG